VKKVSGCFCVTPLSQLRFGLFYDFFSSTLQQKTSKKSNKIAHLNEALKKTKV